MTSKYHVTHNYNRKQQTKCTAYTSHLIARPMLLSPVSFQTQSLACVAFEWKPGFTTTPRDRGISPGPNLVLRMELPSSTISLYCMILLQDVCVCVCERRVNEGSKAARYLSFFTLRRIHSSYYVTRFFTDD